MASNIDLYGVYYPIDSIVSSGKSTITTDSRIVVMEFLGDKVKVCRFGNYKETAITGISNLSKIQTKR